MQDLIFVDLFRDFNDCFFATLEILAELRLTVRLLLEDECRQQSNDLLRLKPGRFLVIIPNQRRCYLLCQHILQDKFGEHQFIGGVDLAGHFPFQLNTRLLVNEA